MKFKILSLLLTAGLALAACDADNSNDKATSPDDKNKSEVDSSEANQSDDVKEDEDSNTTTNSDSNDEDDADDAEEDDEQASSATGNEDDQPIAVDDITATPDDIIKALESDGKTGELTSINFEKENGEWVYKISQNEDDKDMEYTYSMKDKKLLNTEEEMIDKEDQTFDYDEIVSFDEALKKAQDKTSDSAQVKEWSLETEDGITVYNIEMIDDNMEKTVTVDPFEGTANLKGE